MNEPLDRDRLSVITGSLLLALALSRLLNVPIRPLAVNVLGSPLGINLSATTLMLLIVVGLAIAGTESLVRSHPLARQGQLGHTFGYWITPSLLCLAMAAFLNGLEEKEVWLLALLASAIPLVLALTLEYASVNLQMNRPLAWVYLLLAHLIGLALFTIIYEARLRGLFSGPAVMITATLLSGRVFTLHTPNQQRAWGYGFVVGLIMGQMAWLLTYWPLSALQGGLFLLVLFYLSVGLLQQTLSGRVNRRTLIEYSLIALLALGLIAIINY